jgi:hypothetical protein
MTGSNIIAALILSVAQWTPETTRDEIAWIRTKMIDTPNAYQAYIRAHPNGRHFSLAYGQLRTPISPLAEHRIIPVWFQLAQANCMNLGKNFVCRNQSSDRSTY